MDEQFFASIKAIEREQPEFASALGRMILAYADVEEDVYRTLLHYSGVSESIGRPLFGRTKSSVMVEQIRDIADNTKIEPARSEDIRFVFNQFASISIARNMIVHFGSALSYEWETFAPTDRIIQNRRLPRLSNEKVIRINSAVLDDITHDLLKGIHVHLERHYLQDNSFREWVDNGAVNAQWKYRPPSNYRLVS